MADLPGVAANSPFGSWINMYFPTGKDLKLRQQYQLLNLNALRIGRIVNITDSLASDSSEHFIGGRGENS